MKTAFLSLLLLLLNLSLLGQQTAYKFYNEADSLKFHKLQELMRHGIYKDGQVVFGKDTTEQISFDTLQHQLRSITRYKYLKYNRNQSYASLEEVRQSERKDTIKYVSIETYEGHKFPKVLLKCKQLKELELIGTHISKIPWRLNWSFYGLDSLKTLRVYNHRSSKPLKFKKNTHITKLLYRENPYAPFPTNLHKVQSVEDLDLVRNDFDDLKKLRLDKMDHINELNLSRNHIKIEALASDTVRALKNLILSFNALQSVPEEIGYFKNLEELQLGENDITSDALDPALGSLKKLKIISFYKNELDSLPHFLFALTALEELDIYYNEVEILPEQVGNLTELKKLYLANNRFYQIPEAIGDLSHLQELYLHHNRISFLPSSICQLENITDFHIHNNYFTSFPSCILSFNKLEDLDISFNKITSVPPELTELQNLKYLWIRGIIFEGKSKAHAEAMRDMFETLQQRGVKISIELDQEELQADSTAE